MFAEHWLVLAALIFFVVAIILVMAAFEKKDPKFFVDRNARRVAEEHARAQGGWYIFREGAVYRAGTNEELMQQCRDGLIHPTDEIYVRITRTIGAANPRRSAR